MKYPDRYIITGRVAKGSEVGKEVYLYWTEEGGGWWQWTSDKGCAHRFERPSGDRFKDAMNCATDNNWTKASCGPWYYSADPKTVKHISVPAIVKVY